MPKHLNVLVSVLNTRKLTAYGQMLPVFPRFACADTLMSYSQYFLRILMDMGSLLRTRLGTILNYRRDPYVQCPGSLNKPK